MKLIKYIKQKTDSLWFDLLDSNFNLNVMSSLASRVGDLDLVAS